KISNWTATHFRRSNLRFWISGFEMQESFDFEIWFSSCFKFQAETLPQLLKLVLQPSIVQGAYEKATHRPCVPHCCVGRWISDQEHGQRQQRNADSQAGRG